MFFIDNQQPQIFKLYIFVHQLVGANDDVNFTIGEMLMDFPFFLGRSKAVEVIDSDGHIGQSFLERAIVLKGQNCSGHQNGHLLPVIDCLERGPNGHFGLTETYITTDKPVHRALALHIFLDVLGGTGLIGRVFVNKGGLQLVLQIRIRAILKALFQSALGIYLDEVKGDFFDTVLGLLFQLFPCGRTEFIDFRNGTILTVVF